MLASLHGVDDSSSDADEIDTGIPWAPAAAWTWRREFFNSEIARPHANSADKTSPPKQLLARARLCDTYFLRHVHDILSASHHPA